VGSEIWWLAVVAAVNAVLGVAVYLRWLRAILSAPEAPQAGADGIGAGATGGSLAVRVRVLHAHPATLTAVGFAAVALVLTSVNPQLILGLLGS
jgi:NADH-quinone oxidoreductase subunit N